VGGNGDDPSSSFEGFLEDLLAFPRDAVEDLFDGMDGVKQFDKSQEHIPQCGLGYLVTLLG